MPRLIKSPVKEALPISLESTYTKETGDRHWQIGFNRRFAQWLEKRKENE